MAFQVLALKFYSLPPTCIRVYICVTVKVNSSRTRTTLLSWPPLEHLLHRIEQHMFVRTILVNTALCAKTSVPWWLFFSLDSMLSLCCLATFLIHCKWSIHTHSVIDAELMTKNINSISILVLEEIRNLKLRPGASTTLSFSIWVNGGS